jgi:2-oxoglutarate ferredoxin oxidoreductase subunit beta
MSNTSSSLTKKDFESGQEVRWCPGCGDYAILSTFQKVLADLGIPPHKYAIISGIGCSSRFPYYMGTYGFHTIHGRAFSIATGLRLALPDPEIQIWVMSGDGDGLSIGGNQLLHLLRRNLNIKVVIFNNQIYGLTKGQYSPTSPPGHITKSSPFGVLETPVNPVAFALGAGASCVIRTVDRDLKHMGQMFKEAALFEGTVFLEIFQNCIVYNDGAYEYLYDKDQKWENALYVEHKKPMRFGKNGEKGVVLGNDSKPQVVNVAEAGEGKILCHDETNLEQAWILAQMERPVPLGVIYRKKRPVLENLYLQLEEKTIQEKGPGDLKKLLYSGQTWKIS